MKIVVDVASGERPLPELVLGCLDAIRENDEISLIIVGNRYDIENVLSEAKDFDSKRILIRHSDDVIGMTESPTIAVKHKKNASVMVAARVVAHNEAEAFFSPGNTGATLAASLMEIGRLKGVIRPPLMSVLPKKDGGEFCFLDIGGTVDCTIEYLAQFAVMGSVFSKRYSNVSRPRVALLNIGEEDTKGSVLYKKTFERLSKMNINFVGNIEPSDMFKTDKADVVVCDGFDGNLVLKTIEGTASFMVNLMKTEIKKNATSSIAAFFLKPVFKKLKTTVSADAYGSAILLGIKGGAFVGHGKTSGFGIKNSILTIHKFLQARVNEHIVKALSDTGAKKRLF